MTVLDRLPHGCYDDEGFSGRVTLIVALLAHGLRLPFCRPLHDILDLLNLAPAQLHPFALRAYLCACIVFRMVLDPLEDLYPDLTSREFLSFYNLRLATKVNVVSFRKKDKG